MPRSHIYVRPLAMKDWDSFIASTEHSGKYFPSNVFTLPSTRVMVAEKREEGRLEVIAYQPAYISLVLGSIVNVSASDVELASAMHQFTAAAYTRANAEGLADILAFTTNKTEEFAKRHNFHPTHSALRMEVR